MKFFIAALLIMGNTAFADTTKISSEKKEVSEVMNVVEGKGKETKKERKKKVEMCHECGKPETECTCEGEDHAKKK